jgi:choline monooxygenase
MRLINGLLPNSHYFDPEIAALEEMVLFKEGLHYIGHELMAARPLSGRVLELTDDEFAIQRDLEGNIHIVSNVCLHQHALIRAPEPHGKDNRKFSLSVTRGRTQCPVHQWTYGSKGNLIGAPNFSFSPEEKAKCALEKLAFFSWNGLVFVGGTDEDRKKLEEDLSLLGHSDYFSPADFSLKDYFFGGISIEHYPANWKTFKDVYDDDRHVDRGHNTTFGAVTKPETLRFEFGKNETYNVQIVDWNRAPRRKLSGPYAEFHECVRLFCTGNEEKTGNVLWSSFHPNMMLERYPGALVISTIVPDGPEKSHNIIEFYYPKSLPDREKKGELPKGFTARYIKAQKAAYAETGEEDKDFIVRIYEGCRRLYKRGLPHNRKCHPDEELGILKFHEAVRSRMSSAYAERERKRQLAQVCD